MRSATTGKPLEEKKKDEKGKIRTLKRTGFAPQKTTK